MRALPLLLLAGLSAACEGDPPATRAEQCRTLLSVIADNEKGKTESDEPNALLRSANAVERAGAAVTNLNLPDDGLAELRRRYVNMARDLGLTSRDAGLAFAKDDEEAKSRARERLATSRAVEKKLRTELARYCAE